MKATGPQVWECEHAIEVNASPEEIWAVFEDVAGWVRWNRGIERIQLNGPFEAGTTFEMTPPGQETLTTRLVEVQANVGFLDETIVGDLRIFVDHRIEVLDGELCRVIYSLEAFGPSCDEVGPLVSADFPEVLSALACYLLEQHGSASRRLLMAFSGAAFTQTTSRDRPHERVG